MKNIALYFGIVVALVASCSIQEEDFIVNQESDPVFYASFEQPVEDGTRVYANDDLLLRWTADDRVSIFNKITYNQEYKFIGETGDYEGGFNKVDDPEFMTGKVIPDIISVYPFQRQTRVTEDEAITLTLPAEQHYAENSFGLGANTMVSVTSNNLLQYKNVGGYLVFRLYGEGVSVSSITLKGNNGEKLAGKATITMPLDGVPSVAMASDATDEITLVCDSPVLLGSTPEESTAFWFVVPPVTFSNGFTVSINQGGGVSEKSTQNRVTIERSKLSKMARMEVEWLQPNSVIVYTSTDDCIVTPKKSDGFGANIVSNEYVNGLGIITFDSEVTNIGMRAFYMSPNLESISLPRSIKSIGESAFQQCYGLTNVSLPEGLTNIGYTAFCFCSSLSSVNLPESLTTIDTYAFGSCTSLRSVSIPEGITSIGDGVFYGCSSLMSFSGKFASSDGLFLVDSNKLLAVACGSINGDLIIPDSITSFGTDVFCDCIGLTGITLPSGLTSIPDWTFDGCSNLERISIPSGVTSVGRYAFNNCSSLASITLPDGMSSLGNDAFYGCSSLESISLPDGITTIGNYVFSGCTSLSSVCFPSGLTSIENYAFLNCASLEDVSLPSGLASIGNSAFRNCTGLKTVSLPSGLTSIGTSVFSGCFNLQSFAGKYASPDGLFLIDSNKLIAVAYGAINGDLIIPENITGIGVSAFTGCLNLTSITFPNSLLSIEYCAFDGCKNLTSITFPNSLLNIGQFAFDGCVNLSSISLPSGIQSVGEEAFGYCGNLSSITVLANEPPSGGYRMFYETAECPIYVPSGSVNKYKEARYWSDYADRIKALPDNAGPEAVDLGLPSGLMWASFNLGASKPEEYGDYYAWGETEPYYSSQDPLTWKEGKEEGYWWTSYKWCMGSENTLTKYCQNADYGYNGFTDDKTVLDLEDDAAHINLGGKWRMPTDADWAELRTKCTGTWTSRNGVYGHLVTGPNGNSIFLPAAGSRFGAILGNGGAFGYRGVYWSSSLSTGNPSSACNVDLGSGDVYMTYNSRRYGFSVRPVTE